MQCSIRARIMRVSRSLLAASIAGAAIAAHGLYAAEGEPTVDCECRLSEAPQAPDFDGCFCCRPKLTGDWHGHRSCYAENGITFDFDHTYFYYGVASGGLDREFNFAGHGDYVVNFDFGKLADHQGLFLKLRAEHRFGETINANTGALLPATISPDLPVRDSEDLYLTNVLFTQALSENFAVFAGKVDPLDGDLNAFAHGRGKTQFSNMGFVANPILLRTVPYSTLAAGFSVLQKNEPVFTFTVLNAKDTARTSGFEELFDEGVVLVAETRIPTQLLEMPGHQLFGGSWSSREFAALGQDPRIILPDLPVARQSGSWSLYWNFDQHLVMYADQPGLGWGIFGRAGIGDDETNPLASFLSFGIGGNSPICGRHQDTFGVGWYIAESSDEIGPILETSLGPIGDGQGVELYYNYQVTPWCHITPGLQFIDPARELVDTAVVAGVRAKIDF